MKKENQSLDQLDIFKKEIISNLNLLTPKNLKNIQKNLTQYVFNDRIVCGILIEQIIEKAWEQPRYASTYAKLCGEFSKVPGDYFAFHKKENPFKVFLISKIQHSFDKNGEEIPEFQNDQQKYNWLKETKKKILSNVKFIAKLIRAKVLKKRIMKICISQLIFKFLTKYYQFRKTGKIIYSYYDYYFDALIEFIENVGDFYEKMDEASKNEYEKTSSYEPAEKIVIDLIEMNEKPPEIQIEEITNLKADDYFKLFNLIDKKVLFKNNSRLSALLLNLSKRRANNWQKHQSGADGQILKQIKQDIAKEEDEMNKVKQQKKQPMEHHHVMVKTMYKDQDGGEKNNLKQEVYSQTFYVPAQESHASRKIIAYLTSILQDLAIKREWAEQQANKYWSKAKEYEAQGRIQLALESKEEYEYESQRAKNYKNEIREIETIIDKLSIVYSVKFKKKENHVTTKVEQSLIDNQE